MLKMMLQMQKKKQYLIHGGLFFTLYMIIFTMLDTFNIGYFKMIEDFGLYLVIINILLNIVMSLLSAFIMNISNYLVKVNSKEGKGSIFPGIAAIFGIFTYGCTPCVIAFLSTIGIAFSVIVLPLSGLPYKLISLLIIILGLVIILNELKKPCSIQDQNISK